MSSWYRTLKDNNDIICVCLVFHRVMIDNSSIGQPFDQPGSMVVTDLKPYTPYSIQVNV